MDFPDLAGLNPEITVVPIAELVPFHRRTDAGLRVKRLKEPSSSAELVLEIIEISRIWVRRVDLVQNPSNFTFLLRSRRLLDRF